MLGNTQNGESWFVVWHLFFILMLEQSDLLQLLRIMNCELVIRWYS
jgi:hypothetical protein